MRLISRGVSLLPVTLSKNIFSRAATALVVIILFNMSAVGSSSYAESLPLYITGAGAIGAYTTSGAVVNSSLVGGLADPYGLAVSGSDLFVSNNASNTIGKYTTSGAVVNPSLITGLSSSTGIAVSGSDLFVVNTGAGTVAKYTTSGALVNPSLITGLHLPFDIALSGSDLYVLNINDSTGPYGTVGKYTTSGAVVNPSLITGLGTPRSIAIESPSPVPVPAAVWLFGTGLSGLVGIARRQHSIGHSSRRHS